MNREQLLPLIHYWMVEFSLSLTKPQAFITIHCSYKSVSCSLHFLCVGKGTLQYPISTFTHSLRLVSPVMLTKISASGQPACWDLAIQDCWWCLIIFLHSLNLRRFIYNFLPFISRSLKQRSWTFSVLPFIVSSSTLTPRENTLQSRFTACIKAANCKQVSISPPPISTAPWNALTFQICNRQGRQMSIQYILQTEAKQGCRFLLKSPVKCQ